ncbi:28653_t:CDS:2, partial [Gigaspora margarita]
DFNLHQTLFIFAEDKMETELNHIPKKDYKKIKENSITLKIPTRYDLIIYEFNHEFLTKHVKRRELSKNSLERIKIEEENRAFLENYWEVYEVITYWYGYYLNEGIGGDKDENKAKDLYKQAADKNVSGAQLRYAFSLVKRNGVRENKRQEFIKYLTQAADNGNNIAQFNLGDLYLNGKVGFQIDKEKGAKYLKLAAKKGYNEAIALLFRKMEPLDKINIRKNIDDKIQGIYYFTPNHTSNDGNESLFNNHDKDQFKYEIMNENDPNLKPINNDKSESHNEKESLVESFNYYLKKDLNQLSLNNLENLVDHLQKNLMLKETDIELHPLCNNLEIDYYQQKIL